MITRSLRSLNDATNVQQAPSHIKIIPLLSFEIRIRFLRMTAQIILNLESVPLHIHSIFYHY